MPGGVAGAPPMLEVPYADRAAGVNGLDLECTAKRLRASDARLATAM
jgi:hypothetical protein